MARLSSSSATLVRNPSAPILTPMIGLLWFFIWRTTLMSVPSPPRTMIASACENKLSSSIMVADLSIVPVSASVISDRPAFAASFSSAERTIDARGLLQFAITPSVFI